MDRAEGSIRVMFRCDNPGEVYVAVVKDDVTWEPREPDADLRAHAKNVASQLEDIYGKI